MPKKAIIIHHGELVEALWMHSGLTQADFAKPFGRHRTWLNANIKRKKIFRKTLEQICQAYNIPMDYFEGKFNLPKKLEVSLASEPTGEYVTKNSMLEEQIKQLKDKLLQRDDDLLNLKDKYIRLLEEKKETVSQ